MRRPLRGECELKQRCAHRHGGRVDPDRAAVPGRYIVLSMGTSDSADMLGGL